MKIDKILAPTDFSDASESSVRCAVETAAKLGASVTVLHVYALRKYPVLPSGASFVAGPRAVADYLHGVYEEMKQIEARFAVPGVRLDARSVEGAAAETIVRLARDEGYGLIVMGTHGRTGLDHALIGSVAERVVRSAETPVLTIRELARAA